MIKRSIKDNLALIDRSVMMFSCHCWLLHHIGIVIAILFRSHPYFLGVTVCERGLATRLHELTATLFDLEETLMFVGDDPHARLFDFNGKTIKRGDDCHRCTWRGA